MAVVRAEQVAAKITKKLEKQKQLAAFDLTSSQIAVAHQRSMTR